MSGKPPPNQSARQVALVWQDKAEDDTPPSLLFQAERVVVPPAIALCYVAKCTGQRRGEQAFVRPGDDSQRAK